MDDVELVGWDDDGGDEEVGATRRRVVRRVVRRPSSPMTQGRKLAASSQREGALGLGRVTVPAGGTAVLEATALRPIQGRKLVLSPASDAALIDVLDVKIGVQSQMAGTEGVPATAFAADVEDPLISFAPAASGAPISVTLSNTSAGAIVVGGALFGTLGG